MAESKSQFPSDISVVSSPTSPGFAGAAWHSLFWLVVANSIGVLIALLLLFPGINGLLGEWTYGRWIMVHMNLMLYGWSSLPLAGFLFRVYGTERGPLAAWCRPALWAWSAALIAGSLSWLSGHSSGKLFLDWSGFARIVFPLAMLALWLLLALSFLRQWNQPGGRGWAARSGRIVGLILLLAVPVVMYLASSPAVYPYVNPDTGGPTGQSQLESSLMVVAMLLLLPFGLTRRRTGSSRVLVLGWAVLLAESALCFALGRRDISHRSPAQFLSLGSLLVWIPLIPAYFAAFNWRPETHRWRLAFYAWWGALVLTGWLLFLPGLLDHFKFTDGLVGHSFVAMAGFTSSLLIFVMVQILGEGGWIFNRTRSFYAWNIAVVGYIVIMTVAGWWEGYDPAFTIVPGVARNGLYALRLVSGIAMLLASLDWLIDASTLLHPPEPVSLHLSLSQEKTA